MSKIRMGSRFTQTLSSVFIADKKPRFRVQGFRVQKLRAQVPHPISPKPLTPNSFFSVPFLILHKIERLHAITHIAYTQALQGSYVGVSENAEPKSSTLNSRILIIRTPKYCTLNFPKLPYRYFRAQACTTQAHGTSRDAQIFQNPRFGGLGFRVQGLGTQSLHCSSFFGLTSSICSILPRKGTTMETTGIPSISLRHARDSVTI